MLKGNFTNFEPALSYHSVGSMGKWTVLSFSAPWGLQTSHLAKVSGGLWVQVNRNRSATPFICMYCPHYTNTKLNENWQNFPLRLKATNISWNDDEENIKLTCLSLCAAPEWWWRWRVSVKKRHSLLWSPRCGQNFQPPDNPPSHWQITPASQLNPQSGKQHIFNKTRSRYTIVSTNVVRDLNKVCN